MMLHLLTKHIKPGHVGIVNKNPSEIKRREVSWTLMKKLDFRLRVQARSRGGK